MVRKQARDSRWIFPIQTLSLWGHLTPAQSRFSPSPVWSLLVLSCPSSQPPRMNMLDPPHMVLFLSPLLPGGSKMPKYICIPFFQLLPREGKCEMSENYLVLRICWDLLENTAGSCSWFTEWGGISFPGRFIFLIASGKMHRMLSWIQVAFCLWAPRER